MIGEEIQLTYDADDSIIDALRAEYRHGEKLNHRLTDSWPSSVKEYSGAMEVIACSRAMGSEWTLLKFAEGCYISLNLSQGKAGVCVEGTSSAICDEAMVQLRDEVPMAEPPRDVQVVPLTYWSLSPDGPQGATRMLEVPRWEELQHNYVGETQVRTERILNERYRPTAAGQLMLWHGVPGTGKTWAIRGLLWEWRHWASFNYIADPESFFAPEQRWNVLILEDTGELVSADAKKRSGQGLSRLLNLVDGLIGQGMKVLVLITTNEEIKSLHPAITRPGRCAENVLFDRFSVEQSREWFKERGYTGDLPTRGALTVAELYALSAGRFDNKTQGERNAGFTA